MPDAQKHSQASLSPSELVTIAIQFALKPFPHLPVRTRLFRLLNTHRHWMQRFVSEPFSAGLDRQLWY